MELPFALVLITSQGCEIDGEFLLSLTVATHRIAKPIGLRSRSYRDKTRSVIVRWRIEAKSSEESRRQIEEAGKDPPLYDICHNGSKYLTKSYRYNNYVFYTHVHKINNVVNDCILQIIRDVTPKGLSVFEMRTSWNKLLFLVRIIHSSSRMLQPLR